MFKKLVVYAFFSSIFLPSLAFSAGSAVQGSENILAPDGTVYYVANNTLRPYTSGGAFLSFSDNSFSNLMPANSAELNLPLGKFMPPAPGTLICSDRGSDQGTCYFVDSDPTTDKVYKYGFTSSEIFNNLGFHFQNALSGDTSWLPKGNNISDAVTAYADGAVVNADASANQELAADSNSDETELADNLNPDAKQWFLQSIAVRQTYSESDPYKHFLRDRDNDGIVDQMDADGYLHLAPINNHYVPNKALYGDGIPDQVPGTFYRYVKDCASGTTIERQIIDSEYGYANYVGGSRYQQQCVLDGTADEYYVESLTKLE